MTVPLAGDEPRVLQATTIGEAWLGVAERILADGTDSRYDGLAVVWFWFASPQTLFVV